MDNGGTGAGATEVRASDTVRASVESAAGAST